jgi:hypothetical protein
MPDRRRTRKGDEFGDGVRNERVADYLANLGLADKLKTGLTIKAIMQAEGRAVLTEESLDLDGFAQIPLSSIKEVSVGLVHCILLRGPLRMPLRSRRGCSLRRGRLHAVGSLMLGLPSRCSHWLSRHSVSSQALGEPVLRL